MSDAIVIDGVTKEYGTTTAIENLSLTVKSGEIYGFLGSNGAGKSTTINLLMDYVRPTEGSIMILDRDPRKNVVAVHQRVGILPDQFGLYENQSGQAHIDLLAESKGDSEDPERLLNRVGLDGHSKDPVKTYSKGMRQRLALAMSLVGSPELLILDEPFNGLDPHGVRKVREIIHEQNDQGVTVFFSSHVLRQVELVCDRVGIVSNGRLITEGTLEELRSTQQIAPTHRLLRLSINGSQTAARDVVRQLVCVESATIVDAGLIVELDGDGAPNVLRNALEDADIEVRHIEVEPVSMESIFLSHTADRRNSKVPK